MTIDLIRESQRTRCKLPYADAPHVVIESEACPACEHEAPLKLRGTDNQVRGHDFVESSAYSLCCNQYLGRIHVSFSTIFGVEEDSRVLNGPWRVY